MKQIDCSKEYQEVIQSYTDSKLAEIYLHSDNYTKEFISLLLVELDKRGIPIDELTSKEKADLFLIEKKSDEELHEIYTDVLGSPKELRTLAEEEAQRRGLPIDIIKKQRIETRLLRGVKGKHILAGYVFSILGGLIGLIISLDYIYSKEHTADGSVYKYDKTTRKSGKIMVAINVAAAILYIIIAIHS
jgi:hypothetical protein